MEEIKRFCELVDGIPRVCDQWFELLEQNKRKIINLLDHLDAMSPKVSELLYDSELDFFYELKSKLSSFHLGLEESHSRINKINTLIEDLRQVSFKNRMIREDGLKENEELKLHAKRNMPDVQDTVLRLQSFDIIIGNYDFDYMINTLTRLCDCSESLDEFSYYFNRLQTLIPDLDNAIEQHDRFQQGISSISYKELEDLAQCISLFNRQLQSAQEEKEKEEPISELEQMYWSVKKKNDEIVALLLATGKTTMAVNQNDPQIKQKMLLDPLTYGTCYESDTLALARQVVNLFIEGNRPQVQELENVTAQQLLDYFKNINKMPSHDYFADAEAKMIEEVKKRLLASGRYLQYFEIDDPVDQMILTEINNNPNQSVGQIAQNYPKPSRLEFDPAKRIESLFS